MPLIQNHATASKPSAKDRMRVRIHLNLAKPELAETAVRIQAPSGAWSTVGYATELILENCRPVVDLAAQNKISQGSTRKVPHAFIEGDLVHFKGRARSKAPPALLKCAKPHMTRNASFQEEADRARSLGTQVNYNPRFAKCFYQDHADKSLINQKFIECDKMIVMGWSFLANRCKFAPIASSDRCQPAALEKTSLSEKIGIRRGRETTQRLVSALSMKR